MYPVCYACVRTRLVNNGVSLGLFGLLVTFDEDGMFVWICLFISVGRIMDLVGIRRTSGQTKTTHPSDQGGNVVPIFTGKWLIN